MSDASRQHRPIRAAALTRDLGLGDMVQLGWTQHTGHELSVVGTLIHFVTRAFDESAYLRLLAPLAATVRDLETGEQHDASGTWLGLALRPRKQRWVVGATVSVALYAGEPRFDGRGAAGLLSAEAVIAAPWPRSASQGCPVSLERPA